MKRILLLFSLILLASSAFAKGPQLEVEKFFDGRYNDNSKVEWSKVKRGDKMSYYLDFKYDPVMVKEIMDALRKDMNGEDFDTEIVTKSETYYRTVLDRNGYKIDIGLSIPKNGKCSLYIRGNRKALE